MSELEEAKQLAISIIEEEKNRSQPIFYYMDKPITKILKILLLELNNSMPREVVVGEIDDVVNKLSNLYKNSNDEIEQEISKGFAVFATMLKEKLLEGK